MRMLRKGLLLLLLILSQLCISHISLAQEEQSGEIELGEEYSDFRKSRGHSSGQAKTHEESAGIFYDILMYIPNRFLDLIDIPRFDVGFGPSVGAVARVTKYGQVGYRSFHPASVRIGLRGRKSPVFLEKSSEYGIGPYYHDSSARSVQAGEVGVGADLLIAGIYAGISFDQ